MDTFNIIIKSCRNFFKNPFILIPFLIQYILVFILTMISYYILSNYLYLPTVMTLIWLGIIFIITLFIASFFMASIIGISGKVSQNKKITFRDIILFGKKFWLKNLAMIFIILISTGAVFGISFLIGSLVNNIVSLQISTIIYASVFIIGILAFVIFLSFSNFYIVIKNTKIFESIKKSFSLVKRNYLSVLFLWFIFIFVSFIVNLIPIAVVAQLISTFLVNPIIFLVFSLFVIERSKNKNSKKTHNKKRKRH